AACPAAATAAGNAVQDRQHRVPADDHAGRRLTTWVVALRRPSHQHPRQTANQPAAPGQQRGAAAVPGPRRPARARRAAAGRARVTSTRAKAPALTSIAFHRRQPAAARVNSESARKPGQMSQARAAHYPRQNGRSGAAQVATPTDQDSRTDRRDLERGLTTATAPTRAPRHPPRAGRPSEPPRRPPPPPPGPPAT